VEVDRFKLKFRFKKIGIMDGCAEKNFAPWGRMLKFKFKLKSGLVDKLAA
jgi:hypothetical protein